MEKCLFAMLKRRCEQRRLSIALSLFGYYRKHPQRPLRTPVVESKEYLREPTSSDVGSRKTRLIPCLLVDHERLGRRPIAVVFGDKAVFK